jgi:tetratricopeptide (TPR) repeat protein
MNKKRKTTLYILGGAIGLAIVVLLLRFVTNSQFSSKIPEIQNTDILSQAVKIQISDALNKARHNPTADNLGKLGMVYHSSANYELAAQCYELALKKKKSDWIWNYYLGYLNTEMGKSDAAIEYFNRVIKKNPLADHAWYYIGQEYKNLRKNELAENALNKISIPKNKVSSVHSTTREDHFPISVYAKFLLSRIYFDNGNNDLAEKTLQDIVQRSGLFGPAYRLLGNIYAMKGDSTFSKQYGDKANDLLVFSPPVDTLVDKIALMSRSELYLLKKIDEAEKSVYPDWALKLVNNALLYLPDNKFLISKAIRIFLWNKQDKQAAGLIDQHIEFFQESFSEMKNMGLLFYQRGLYLQAMKYWNVALVLKPDDIETKKNLALCFYYTGDKQKSYDLLDELLAKNQNSPGNMADVTYLIFHLGMREKAISYLTRLKQIAPSNPIVQKMSGEIAETNGKFLDAVKLYESSFNGNPEDLQTIRYLGNLLIKQKMWEKYIRLYREALKYHPNESELLERLGTCLIVCPDPSFRNIEEGIIYSERAFTHIKSATNTMISAGKNLAFAYALLGNKQKAITTISQTINIGRQERIPPAYQAELENLYKTIKNIEINNK